VIDGSALHFVCHVKMGYEIYITFQSFYHFDEYGAAENLNAWYFWLWFLVISSHDRWIIFDKWK
jgi:hypothetical protein